MKDINEYISQQESPQKEICQRLRELIKETLPNIKEEMKWGVPSFGDGAYYLVALKTHVNLGFSMKGLSAEELSLFDGGGKTTKHIEISSLDNLDEGRIIKLLKLIHQQK